MRKYQVKGSQNFPEVLTIIHESANSFKVMLEKSNGYGLEVREEVMSKQLFESCLRTSYLTELTPA